MLVDNAGKFYKMWSIRLAGLTTVVSLMEQHWAYFDQLVPPHIQPYVTAGFGVATIVARVIKQESLHAS